MSKLFAITMLLNAASAKTWNTIADGPTYDITWDAAKSKFKFDVNTKAGVTLWIVWSTTGATVATDIV